jgi:hypothetical protein
VAAAFVLAGTFPDALFVPDSERQPGAPSETVRKKRRLRCLKIFSPASRPRNVGG